ncbi:hypothetical protein Afe04nite_07760 [Asanoa ferruginea]|uniref:hypothetical protein n=1 Tax=Asanoa ferruginea TaxID=53367 RepID=UPI000E2317BC|nr:hypothetical protein [Asanoa ferruginea]GIF46237.1 hypothetical protein Afe04nite_07760 [Asanoa ferruginea]
MSGRRVVAGLALSFALAGCLAGVVGGIAGWFGSWWWAIAVVAGAFVVAWFAARAAAGATVHEIRALLTEFLAAATSGDHEAAHRRIYHGSAARLLPGDFSVGLAGLDIVRLQITRNLNRGSDVRNVAKVGVRLRLADGDSADYLFLLVREGRTWTVDQWLLDGEFDMVDYSPE